MPIRTKRDILFNKWTIIICYFVFEDNVLYYKLYMVNFVIWLVVLDDIDMNYYL